MERHERAVSSTGRWKIRKPYDGFQNGNEFDNSEKAVLFLAQISILSRSLITGDPFVLGKMIRAARARV